MVEAKHVWVCGVSLVTRVPGRNNACKCVLMLKEALLLWY